MINAKNYNNFGTGIGLLLIFSLFLFYSCSVSKPSITERKYSPRKLREDYKIFRGALEESHPGLYWFTPKNQIDSVFESGYAGINDSMTERQFRTLLLKTITPIRLFLHQQSLRFFALLIPVQKVLWRKMNYRL